MCITSTKMNRHAELKWYAVSKWKSNFVLKCLSCEWTIIVKMIFVRPISSLYLCKIICFSLQRWSENVPKKRRKEDWIQQQTPKTFTYRLLVNFAKKKKTSLIPCATLQDGELFFSKQKKCWIPFFTSKNFYCKPSLTCVR